MRVYAKCKILLEGKQIAELKWPMNKGTMPPTIGKLICVFRRDHVARTPGRARTIVASVQQRKNKSFVAITDDYSDVEVVGGASYQFYYFHCCLGQTIPVNTVIVWDTVHGENSALTRWSTNNDYVILLLGESGIGKTTFINNIVNLLRFESLQEAVDSDDMTILIPSVHCTEDADGNPVTVPIGTSSDDPNEVLVPGQAATQKPQLHVFCHDNKVFKLIDVPGTLDNRGTDQDRLNMQYTLDCLLTFEKIHAVCVLLNPNENRLGTALKYNINLLFSHLHKSTANNIIFCFTNSRQVNFRGGNFIPILQNYLNQLNAENGVHIAANRGTLFYFDNEALICWALRKSGHLLDEELPHFANSWDKSSESLQRLLARISELEPFQVHGMKSICMARKTLLDMLPLLAEISILLVKNRSLTEEAELRINKENNKNQNDLHKCRYIKQLALEKKPIDYPRTVCTSLNCVDYNQVGSTPEFEVHYKTLCHSHCYLNNIPVEKYPVERLQYCWAFDGGRRKSCRVCNCPWSTHKHITYLATMKEIEVMNFPVESKILSGTVKGTKELARTT